MWIRDSISTIAPDHIIKLKSNPIISVDKDTPVKMNSAVLLPLGLIILVLRLNRFRSVMSVSSTHLTLPTTSPV